ncbi:hypothetical protein PLANPX_3714 [Lacipirellula parvula]|uniref:Uncharacterized protein n=1 Tax=Lacipirellula parvula TaxID=2650471 RepID=A0A5K7XDM5_9BACT|nr:hypothetical protein PLANPX_3714 [Lacipirellula parvula]
MTTPFVPSPAPPGNVLDDANGDATAYRHARDGVVDAVCIGAGELTRCATGD